MPPAQRHPEFSDVAGACLRQWTSLADVVDQLPDDVFAVPTRLAGWRVAELVAHFAACVNAVPRRLAESAPAAKEVLSVARYLTAAPGAGDVIAQREVDTAAGKRPSELRENLAFALVSLRNALADATGERVVNTRFGPMRINDFVVTRCVEGVVHGLDLAQVPGVVTVSDLEALRITTRALLDTMVERAPGRAVELRVPPIAAFVHPPARSSAREHLEIRFGLVQHTQEGGSKAKPVVIGGELRVRVGKRLHLAGVEKRRRGGAIG